MDLTYARPALLGLLCCAGACAGPSHINNNSLPGTSDSMVVFVPRVVDETRGAGATFGTDIERFHLMVRARFEEITGIPTVPENDSPEQRKLRAQLLASWKDSCRKDSCKVELGQALSATHNIQATVSNIGTNCQVEVALLDLRAQSRVRTQTQTCPCGSDNVLASLDAVTRNIAGAGPFGTLIVTSNTSGVPITLDDQDTGLTTPAAIPYPAGEVDVKVGASEPRTVSLDAARAATIYSRTAASEAGTGGGPSLSRGRSRPDLVPVLKREREAGGGARTAALWSTGILALASGTSAIALASMRSGKVEEANGATSVSALSEATADGDVLMNAGIIAGGSAAALGITWLIVYLSGGDSGRLADRVELGSGGIVGLSW